MHYWAKSRNGKWVIKRKTARKRLKRAMKAVWHWCRDSRHHKVFEQHRTLRSKLLGHYQYYGIRGNYKTMEVYYRYTINAWRRWLGRRTRNGYITWEEFFRRYLKAFPLPPPSRHSCIDLAHPPDPFPARFWRDAGHSPIFDRRPSRLPARPGACRDSPVRPPTL